MGNTTNKPKKALTADEFSSLLEKIIKEEYAKLLKEADEVAAEPKAEPKDAPKTGPGSEKKAPASSARKLEIADLDTLKDFASFAKTQFPKMSSSISGPLSRIETAKTEKEARSHISALLGGRDGDMAGNLSRLADLFYDRDFLKKKLISKKMERELKKAEEEGPEIYAGKLKAATSDKPEKRSYDTAEGPNQMEWGEIGKFLGVSLQAAQQMFDKVKEKLQTFLDGDFDAAEYKSTADELLETVGEMAFQAVKNSVVALSQAPEDVEGVLESEIQKFFNILTKGLSSMTRNYKVVLEAPEQDFWRNLFAQTLDMVVSGEGEADHVSPEQVRDMLQDTIDKEFYRGWDEQKLATMSDLIQEKRRELIFTVSKNASTIAPEAIEEIKRIAPDMPAASVYVMEHPEQFPENVNAIADELRNTMQQLVDENHQSLLGSVQDAISKSVYFPNAARGKKPKREA